MADIGTRRQREQEQSTNLTASERTEGRVSGRSRGGES
jgi:hypothetical protein